MSENVKEVLVDGSLNTINNAITEVSDLLSKYTEPTVDLFLTAVRIQALSTVVLYLVVACTLMYAMYSSHVYSKKISTMN